MKSVAIGDETCPSGACSQLDMCNASLTSATAVEGAETLEPESGAAPL